MYQVDFFQMAIYVRMAMISIKRWGSSGQLQPNLEIGNFTGGLQFPILGDSVKKPEKIAVSTDIMII